MLLIEIMNKMEAQVHLRGKNSKMPGGTKGLTEGYDPHMLYVARLCEESWAIGRKEKTVDC